MRKFIIGFILGISIMFNIAATLQINSILTIPSKPKRTIVKKFYKLSELNKIVSDYSELGFVVKCTAEGDGYFIIMEQY